MSVRADSDRIASSSAIGETVICAGNLSLMSWLRGSRPILANGHDLQGAARAHGRPFEFRSEIPQNSDRRLTCFAKESR